MLKKLIVVGYLSAAFIGIASAVHHHWPGKPDKNHFRRDLASIEKHI